MITADQLVAHAVGDYILQSDWMATEKTRRHLAAAVHAITYGLPFLLITTSPFALGIIVGTHFVIDRWRLARWLVGLKNALGDPAWWREPEEFSGQYLTATGYPEGRPAWMSVWLLIIADNILHVVINGLAIRFAEDLARWC